MAILKYGFSVLTSKSSAKDAGQIWMDCLDDHNTLLQILLELIQFFFNYRVYRKKETRKNTAKNT